MSDNDITGTSLEVLSFMASGIKKRSGSDYSDGRPGRINYHSEDEYRTITLTVQANAEYMQRVAHLRDSINELFEGEFLLREKRIKELEVEYESPGQRTGELQLGAPEYVNGKQIKVAMVNVAEIEDTLLTSTFVVEFETIELPYAESIYTTLELHDSGYEASKENYGLVDDIDVDKTNYRFKDNQFTVFNAGNVVIEPENMFLEIMIKNVVVNESMTLLNKTNGEKHVYHFSTTAPSDYRIKNINVTRAGVNVFRNTNKRFISLLTGDNDFEITGATFSEIYFNFKYYYK